MAAEEPRIAEVIMTMTAPNGDRVDLVSYSDGSCGVLCNGQPIPGKQWSPCRMRESTAELLRQAGYALP